MNCHKSVKITIETINIKSVKWGIKQSISVLKKSVNKEAIHQQFGWFHQPQNKSIDYIEDWVAPNLHLPTQYLLLTLVTCLLKF